MHRADGATCYLVLGVPTSGKVENRNLKKCTKNGEVGPEPAPSTPLAPQAPTRTHKRTTAPERSPPAMATSDLIPTAPYRHLTRPPLMPLLTPPLHPASPPLHRCRVPLQHHIFSVLLRRRAAAGVTPPPELGCAAAAAARAAPPPEPQSPSQRPATARAAEPTLLLRRLCSPPSRRPAARLACISGQVRFHLLQVKSDQVKSSQI